VTDIPENLLAPAPVDAAVAALAERNRHHFEGMSEEERVQAVGHWRDLVVTVLTAAGAALAGDATPGPQGGPGRALLVFEDAGGDQVQIHASFHPDLEDLGNGEVSGTPAQAMALEALQGVTEDTIEDPE
jgi:hypothetical protein